MPVIPTQPHFCKSTAAWGEGACFPVTKYCYLNAVRQHFYPHLLTEGKGFGSFASKATKYKNKWTNNTDFLCSSFSILLCASHPSSVIITLFTIFKMYFKLVYISATFQVSIHESKQPRLVNAIGSCSELDQTAQIVETDLKFLQR